MKILHKERFGTLLDYLYIYAYNGLDDDLGIVTIRNFVARYFEGRLTIIGEGATLSLHEDGQKINIDEELKKRYPDEEFSYFL